MTNKTKTATAFHLDGGTAADILTGLDARQNVIYGGAGDDLITGGSQDDILVGDAGADTLRGGAGDDAMWGGGGNDSLSGGTGADYLSGDGGDDILDGGTGADTLIGGVGNDTYIVDNVGDVVTEKAGEGIDTVQASISYTLTANVENLILTGSAAINGTGNDLDNRITGNSAANVLDARGGNDVVDGGGGADTMIGGKGNDFYYVDNAGDVIVELSGEGNDTVQASIDYVLPANVETLILTGSGNVSGTGNALAGSMLGNIGNNVLDGGAGADSLAGGAGNDTYVVDNAGDVVTEGANAGTDTVQASVTYTLGANLENLTLTGAANVNGTGNELANSILGNTGNNVLSGGLGNDTVGGGEGADTIDGGDGNDALNGGGGKDVIVGGTGNDGIYGGGADDTISGGAGNDRIFGDGGNDIIQGGAGSDTMTGGQQNGQGADGADTFSWTRLDVVDGAGRATGLDHITDFGVNDRLDFTGVFNNTHPASLAAVVHVTDAASGTVVSADMGGGNFVDVVVLDGVHHVTLDDLVHNHQIIT